MVCSYFFYKPEVTAEMARSGFSILQVLLVVFLQLWAGSAGASTPPVVDDFSASPPVVAPGGMVTFTIQAHDPDCPDICVDGCGL